MLIRQTLVIAYLVITAAVAVYASILEIQPALFFIEFIAPTPGDRYSLTFVLLITWLLFLIPLVVFMLIGKMFRADSPEVIDSNRTGIFVKRPKAFQSALIGIPVFVNDTKVGIVDNGKTIFFDVPIGLVTVQVGEGKQASEIIEVKMESGNQLNFEFNLKQAGLFIEIELIQIEKIGESLLGG